MGMFFSIREALSDLVRQKCSLITSAKCQPTLCGQVSVLEYIIFWLRYMDSTTCWSWQTACKCGTVSLSTFFQLQFLSCSTSRKVFLASTGLNFRLQRVFLIFYTTQMYTFLDVPGKLIWPLISIVPLINQSYWLGEISFAALWLHYCIWSDLETADSAFIMRNSCIIGTGYLFI